MRNPSLSLVCHLILWLAFCSATTIEPELNRQKKSIRLDKHEEYGGGSKDGKHILHTDHLYAASPSSHRYVFSKRHSRTFDVLSFGAIGDGVSDDTKVNKLDADGLFNEMVHEMEEILLDSGESRGAKFPLDNHEYTAHQSHHLRDGSSTASTSGTDDAYQLA